MDLQKVKNNLEKRGFSVKVFETGREATTYLTESVQNACIGIGGSVTVQEMGLFDALSAKNEVWWHNHASQLAKYGDVEIRNRAREAEVYISSVNGMSMDGQIVNIDGRGNRIAATAYGHKKVILLVGKNKIAEDLDGAIWRARNIAAPKNARRLGLKTPCAMKADKCYDCSSPERICCGFLITERAMRGQETEIILIDENLGY